MIPPRRYFRVMLGRKSGHAEACREGGFIGGDWNVDTDLTGKLPEDWRAFNQRFVPVYLKNHPGMSGVAAGLA